jgi:hypothetical protein
MFHQRLAAKVVGVSHGVERGFSRAIAKSAQVFSNAK